MIHVGIIEWAILALTTATGTWALRSELASMAQHRSLRSRRDAQKIGMADELLYRRLIRSDVIKLANGAYLAMFEVTLPRKEELTEQTIADSDAGFAKALACWGSDTVLHLHNVRTLFHEYDTPETYPHPILAWMDGIRRDWFLTPGRVFTARSILSITWMPPQSATDRLRASISDGTAHAAATEDAILVEFSRRCDAFASFASAYGGIRRLGVAASDGLARSEMLEHLAWCIGGHDQPLCVPHPGQALNGLLAEQLSRRPLHIAGQHVRVLVVKALPPSTYPMLLNRLHELATPYSLIVRFLPDDGDRARKMVHDAHTAWVTKAHEATAYVDPHAAEQAESARQAIGAIAQGFVRFGRASIFVVIRHKEREAADELARRCEAKLKEVGLATYIADWTVEDDYLATLPGDGYHSVRKHTMHALNVTHIFSAHGESLGRRSNGSRNLPVNTPAVFYAVTPSRSQVRVHLSDADITDVGHHIGIGGTGLGKSALLGALAASYMARFPGAGFTGIDKGRSLYRLTRFLDGTFYDLLGADSPGFALFSDIEQPEHARKLIEILREMVQLQGVDIAPHHQTALEDALKSMRLLPSHMRSLTAYLETLQDRDKILIPALRNYTRQSPLLGNVLDCERDTFTSSRFNVVEIGRLMDLGEQYLIPVLRVLFWKARSQASLLASDRGAGDLHWLYQIDEAHTLLKHPIGREFIRSLWKEGRKEKFSLGLWSNAAEDFAAPGIGNDLDEACRTRFIFKNTDVKSNERVRAIYETLGVSPRGLHQLPHLAPRNLLLIQPKTDMTWVIDPALDKTWLAVVGRTDKRDNERVDEYIERHGSRWREELLQYEGVDAAHIRRLTQLVRAHHDPVSLAS
jgi:type IV secretion system protein VirB4